MASRSPPDPGPHGGSPEAPFPGRAAAPPDGSRVYAVGDIHGRRDLLDVMHALIAADAAGFAGRKVVVYLGDYVDRGPDSKGVIDRLAAPPPPGFERVCLAGNHEAWMREFLADPSVGPAWLFNGGGATLASYGVALDAGGGPRGRDHLERMRADLAGRLPPAHKAFLDGLQLSHIEGGYLFVHAGIRPGVPLERQRSDDLLWIRDDFLYSDADFGRMVVHGHTISAEPEIAPNRIGIDTGAFATGRLTCLVLEGERQRFLFATG